MLSMNGIALLVFGMLMNMNVSQNGEASMNEQFTLVFFRGCPNAELARQLVSDLKISCVYILQDDLSEGDPLRSYSSPSLLVGDQVVFGALTGKNSKGCSLVVPRVEEIKQTILELRSKSKI